MSRNDLLAAVLLLAGALRLIAETMNGDKDRRGWLVMIASSLVTVTWCWVAGSTALAILSIATILVAVRGWIVWGRIEDVSRLEAHDLRNRLAARDARIWELEHPL